MYKKRYFFGPLIKVEKVKKKKEIAKQDTVCLANGLEVSKFENFKKGSKFLKEPLATELINESDHFTNDAVQLLKFHGSYQQDNSCLLYTSPSPRDTLLSRMPSSA